MGFMHLENETKRKIKTENKTHQGKRSCDVNFCRTFISSIYLFLELAGSNYGTESTQAFQSHLASFVFANCACCLCKCRKM